MSDKKKKIINWIGILLILASLVLIVCWRVYYIYLSYDFSGASSIDVSLNYSKSSDSSKTKADVVAALFQYREIGKYGDWPLKWVDLSAKRGNPFAEK